MRFSHCLAAVLAVASTAHAQQSTSPRIGYVFPAGGRQDSTLMVMIGGRYLDGAAHAFVSGKGVQAKVVEYLKTNRPEQIREFVTKLTKLEQKKAANEGKKASRNAWTAEDELLMMAVKRKVAAFVGGQPAPAIAESVLVQLTIAPDAEPGHRELRLETSKGLTNPQIFCVGQLPEFFKEPNINEEVRTGKNVYKYREEPRSRSGEAPTQITLPAVVNGQIMPGGADQYAFAARKGQGLVIAVSARELIPYISDAVPGWFQAAVTLFDQQGRELAYADHYRFLPDPALYFEIPQDGNYVIEIRDSIYRGREDFVYRAALGEIPFITSLFPLGGPADEETNVELAGWNLPAVRVQHNAKEKPPGVYPLSARKGDLVSNVLPFAVDALPEVLEKEPNNLPAAAQAVKLPVIVNGRIDRPDDGDVFRFEGRAGAVITAEIFARRLNSPLDSVLKLTDAAGKQLALNDDHEDKGAGLTTQHADSYVRATLPADGTYYVHLGDAQHQGGPECAYRLRIGPAQPDFDLRVAPSSFTVRGNAAIPLTVYALRRDGFAGEIALDLKDAPEGFVLLGEGVPAGQDEARLTLKIAAPRTEEPVSLTLEGRAAIDGREAARLALPADDMTQAFEYHHLVPAQELKLAVLGNFVARPSVTIVSPTPIKIPRDGAARVRLHVPARMFPAGAAFELRKPPDGISVKSLSLTRERMELVVQSDAARVQVGMKGILNLAAVSEKPPPPAKGKAKPKPQRPSLAALPGIPFEIVER